jgi:phospholipid-binding lipoprotein MlaA
MVVRGPVRRRHKAKIVALATLAVAALGLAACATPPEDPAERAAFERTNDPFEPTNRVIFDANMVVDKWLIEPAAEAYRDGVPDLIQVWLRNLLRWAHEPTVLANNLLQGDVSTAGRTAARFAINTLLGPVGFRDMAQQAGYEKQVGDFGQTLHVWGFAEGPYLVLPVLGPSNLRDTVGLAGDMFLDPVRYFGELNKSSLIRWGRFAAEGLDERAQNIDALDELKRSAVDFYAQLRSIMRQRRAAQLHEPPPEAAPGASDLYSDPAARK